MAGISSIPHSAPRAVDEISDEEKNSFKLIKMVYDTARWVLFVIYEWGTLQAPGQTIEQYLLNNKGYSITKVKKIFDVSQRQKLSDPHIHVSNYDITLLFKLLHHVCDKLELEGSPEWTTRDEGRLEWLLTTIKNFRNDISHSGLGITKENLIYKTGNVLTTLENALSVAGTLYIRNISEVEEKKNKVRNDIMNIRDQDLGRAELGVYEIRLLNEKLKTILKKEGSNELKIRYENCTQINPVSFLEGKKVLLRVKSIFTQIEVESAGERAKGSSVTCADIIAFCRDNNSDSGESSRPQPEVFLIEGPAGSGKTTLMKYIKSEWSSPTCSMNGLSDFDLILYLECRNHSISSFSQLLDHLLPNTNVKYFRQGEMKKFIFGLKTLLLVDGLDEMNPASEDVFLEVLSMKSDNLVILCTSRPEKLHYFHTHVTSEYHSAHLKIIGIADSKIEKFIIKYHSEMVRLGLSIQDTDSLVRYLKKTKSKLQRHLRLPLNLVVLVWLWADDPSRILKITTASELYMETLTLMKKKLIERLGHNDATMGIDCEVLEERVNVFITSMCREALVSLCWDVIEKFLPDSIMRMKTTCNANSLPVKEVMSAFLVINTVDGEEQVSFPHKLLHEFYASIWIKQNLFNENKKVNNSELLQKLAVFLEKIQAGSTVQQQNILSDSMMRLDQSASPQKPGAIRGMITEMHNNEGKPLKLSKYQSLLLQVAGVLYAQNAHQIEKCSAEEIVELLYEAELGQKDNNEWWDLIDNVKNDRTIIMNVTKHIKKNLSITEDHIEAALLILENTNPKIIKVDIGVKCEGLPELGILLDRVADCNCQLDVYFRYEFKYPRTDFGNDHHLKTVIRSCQLGEFVGHISGESVTMLPDTTTLLNLAVTDDAHATRLMKYLQEGAVDHYLVGLCLHITSNVSPSALEQLPDLQMLWLLLSDINDSRITRVCEIAAKLLPPDAMFVDIRFPHSDVSFEGWKRLLQGMKDADVAIGHLTIPEEKYLSEEEFKSLKDTAHSLRRCDFRKYSEDQMWESALLAM
ncbi:hypothetical protein Pcinc_017063 [Petrolisthes cinctipes]|uniref:NACHT domain-containing protein n=1 Tax=Petrolisthes cinctipes TaxID=88211 RepID=A0AAE1KQB7_PETCI|nr:hypothetical protein Pcinc_017063 [Petrolisthes cinctipes]